MYFRLFPIPAFALGFLNLAFVMSSAFGEDSGLSKGLSEAKFNAFTQQLEAQVLNLQGAAVAIVQGGKVIYKKTFGSTQEGGEAIQDDTLFGLASVSKPIVATSVAYAVKGHRLKFEDKAFLPWVQEPLTVSHILSHTSGYPIRGDDEIESGKPREELLDFLKHQAPQSPPGTTFYYSNLLYSLIEEALIQKGLSLVEALESLNQALGEKTFFYLPLEASPTRARPYSRDKQPFPFPSLYQKHVMSSAGLFASLEGMVEFLKLAMGERPEVLDADALKALYDPLVEAPDVRCWKNLPFEAARVGSFYGRGWRILYLDKKESTKLIFHGGFINGVCTFIGFVPEHTVGFIFLANQTSPLPTRSGLAFWKAVVD